MTTIVELPELASLDLAEVVAELQAEYGDRLTAKLIREAVDRKLGRRGEPVQADADFELAGDEGAPSAAPGPARARGRVVPARRADRRRAR